MISLKRNSKGILTKANGLRTRSSSIYIPFQTQPFKISRSKFVDFLACRRCFYLDRVGGLVSPSVPGWTLNETVDRLLKREFDLCRENQVPHRVFAKFGFTNIVPFKHPDIDLWRDSLHHGLQYQAEGSNIILHGGIDDVWFDQSTQELIVVDYKSQATRRLVTTEGYLAGVYHQGYKIQLEFYSYLLVKMGFPVSDVGYFYVCNADVNTLVFDGQLAFEETLVPYELNTDWIANEIDEMTRTLNTSSLPARNSSCENCAYGNARAILEKTDPA